MKAVLLPLALFGAISIAFAGISPPTAKAPAPARKRVGVYDSRALAFAHFWSEAEQKRLNAKVAEAKAARAEGDAQRAAMLSRALAEDQKRSHLQVFSTAPATEAMTALQSRLPALQQELGVDAFVSKWDPEALRGISEAAQIDVTDRLVREFNIPLQRQKTVDAMKKTQPLPLEKARRLVDEGKL